MNALTSALWDAFSFVADKISQAVSNTAFFMFTVHQKIRYYFIFGTTDPYARMLRIMKEDEMRWEESRVNKNL